MKTKTLSALCLLAAIFPLTAGASDYVPPKVTITGPESVRPGGRMIIVRANLEKSTANLISIKYNWTVLIDGEVYKNIMPWPDGSLVVFASGETEGYASAILDVDCVFGTPNVVDGKTVYGNVEMVSPELSVFTVKVEGNSPSPEPTPPSPVPIPTPTPTPTPVPDPTFPPGRFGLSKFMYDAFKSDTSMTGQEKAQVASALASSYRGIASKIAAVSTYIDFVAILTDTAASNKAAVTATGIDRNKTLNLNKVVGDKIFELTASDKATVKTASDIKDAWNEIANGLSSVKGAVK